jgi:hypothetical protein
LCQTTEIISELERAAYTLEKVTPTERRRLIEHGVTVVNAQRKMLHAKGNVKLLEPGFMTDMGTLAELAGRSGDIDILISSGMLMLAAEIQRLDQLGYIR